MMKMTLKPKTTMKAKVTRADGTVEYYDATNVTSELMPDTEKKPDTKPANEE